MPVSARTLFLAAVFLWGCAPSARALEIPPKPATYMSDRAEMISPQTQANLERRLAVFDSQTSNQIVVATFPSLENESLEDFSIRLAEAWKPGQKEKDNGVILIIFKDERALRIEVGYGLEGVLTDAQADLIIRQVIVPSFKRDDYDEGISQGVQAIMGAVAREGFSGTQQGGELTAQEIAALRAQGKTALMMILFLIGVLCVLDGIRYYRYIQGHKTYRERYAFWEWWIRFAILFFMLQFILRLLFYAMLASRGGYYGSRSGFGGFSGGGGGFGGGGASGRW